MRLTSWHAPLQGADALPNPGTITLQRRTISPCAAEYGDIIGWRQVVTCETASMHTCKFESPARPSVRSCSSTKTHRRDRRRSSLQPRRAHQILLSQISRSCAPAVCAQRWTCPNRMHTTEKGPGSKASTIALCCTPRSRCTPFDKETFLITKQTHSCWQFVRCRLKTVW